MLADDFKNFIAEVRSPNEQYLLPIMFSLANHMFIFTIIKLKRRVTDYFPVPRINYDSNPKEIDMALTVQNW